jgi:hypothetical protein
MAESAADMLELQEHSTDILMYENHMKGHEGLSYARTKNGKILTVKAGVNTERPLFLQAASRRTAP